MAKKKKADDAAGAIIDSMIKAINKEEGIEVAYKLDDKNNPSNITDWISTGIKGLDFIISNRLDGGIPCGRITNIYGEEGSGKSLVAIKTAVECQKEGGFVVYFDSESALDRQFATHLGLDINKIMIVPGPLTVEDVFKRMETFISMFKTNPDTKDTKILFVWDSIAATPTQKDLDIDLDDFQKLMAWKPRLLGFGLKRIGGLLAEHKIALILLNQAMTDINVRYGDNEKQSGGRQMLHWCSVVVKLNKKNAQKSKIDNKLGGGSEGTSVDVRASVKKNRCGPPHREYEFTMNYLDGPNEHNQMREQIVRLDPFEVEYEGEKRLFSIAKKGAWYKAMICHQEVNPEADYAGAAIKETIFQKTTAGVKFIEAEEWKGVLDQALDHLWTRQYQYTKTLEQAGEYAIQLAADELSAMADGLEGA